jgi:hypothetical protein
VRSQRKIAANAKLTVLLRGGKSCHSFAAQQKSTSNDQVAGLSQQ